MGIPWDIIFYLELVPNFTLLCMLCGYADESVNSYFHMT